MSPIPIGGAQQGIASPPGEAMWSRTLSPENVEQLKELREVMEQNLIVTPRKKKARQPHQDTTDKTKPPAAKSGPGKKRNRTPSSSSSEETDTQMSLANSSEFTYGGSSTGDSDSSSQSEGELMPLKPGQKWTTQWVRYWTQIFPTVSIAENLCLFHIYQNVTKIHKSQKSIKGHHNVLLNQRI